MSANSTNSGLNMSVCYRDDNLLEKSPKQNTNLAEIIEKRQLSSLQNKISKIHHKQLYETRKRNINNDKQSKRGRRRRRTNKQNILNCPKASGIKRIPFKHFTASTSTFCIKKKSITSLLMITLLLIIIKCLLTSLLAATQCPWTRETAELHSDCICDFNPSQTTNLENQHLVNRMSVQCSPVNFQQLLKALKQSASIELPRQLLSNLNNHHPTTGGSNTIQLDDIRENQVKDAALQLASQTKLDLLHVSNSTINLLTDNLFIYDSMANTESNGKNNSSSNFFFESRHLVVAIQSLHLTRCGIEQIQANAFNGLEWSLTSLSLSDNKLETIPVTALRRLINLKVLDLSNNKLFHVKANSFATLNKLNTLRLADNHRLGQLQSQPSTISIATTITSTTTAILFTGIPKGRINNSTLQAIDLQAFVGLEASLTDLNLKNTHLESFPMAIKTLRNLAFLNLAQNQISHIPPRSFEFINSLTAINIERNRLSNIENDTFLGVENSLSSLSLLGNLLEIYPVHQLSKLTALRRLDMGFNRIEILPYNSFISNKRLILIALDGNPLETLPEVTFKPLEGTLRGMSIGGKNLNCDCHLSWMLRWQLEYNLQISSREREPQFCGKPHYLRSLVSFKALKPEHLTCSSDPAPTDGIANSNIGHIFQGSPIIHQSVQQQPVYTIQRANFSGGLSTNGWMANDPQSNSYSYFTLPVPFTAEPAIPTTTTTTKAHLATPYWTNVPTTPGSQRQPLNEADKLAQPQIITTTRQPDTTKLMANTQRSPAIEVIEPREERKRLTAATRGDDVANHGDKQPLRTPSVGFTEYIGTTDLTEASTNEEPTLRNDQVPATTELNMVDLDATTSSQQQAQKGSTSSDMKANTEFNQNLSEVASLYGDRTMINNTSNFTESNVQMGQNGLASLPDDELFANNNPVTRKTNRHGYLANSQTASNQHGIQPPITTSAVIDEIYRSPTRQQDHQTTMSKPSSQIMGVSTDLFRRNNYRGAKSTTTTTMAPVFEPTSSTLSAMAGNPVITDSGTRLKPIKSVFGSRAGENNKREYRRPTSLLPQLQQQQTKPTSNPPLALAVPTAINLYKTHHQVQSNQSSHNHQSSQLNSSSTSSLFKGARFVDDSPLMPIRSYPSRGGPSFRFNQTTGKHTIDQAHLVDSDIERYAATSNVDTRVQSGGTDLATSTKPSLDFKAQKGQRNSEWESATLPTIINNENRQFSWASPPPATTTTTTTATTNQANRMFANNTRMSVSSMYRLATINSLRQSSSTTMAPTTLVNQNVTKSMLLASSPPSNLEAAAESETQKITRTPAIPSESPTLPFLLTTAHRQFLSNRPTVESKKISSSNSMPELSSKVTWTISNTSSSTAQTRLPELQTTIESINDQRLPYNSNSSAEIPATTTRMATTVRFVDSSPPLVRISTSQTSTASNTSLISAPSTTIRPTQLAAKGSDKVSRPTISDSSSKRSTNNSSSTESGPSLIESTIPSLELSKFKSSNQQQPDQVVASTATVQVITDRTTTTKRPQQQTVSANDLNRNTIAVVVGEQQHEARLTLTSNPKTTKQPILHAIGSQVIQPIDSQPTQQEQATTFSLPTIETQRDLKARESFNHNHQRQGRDDSSAFTFGGGSSQNFFGKLTRMADFDQLALILAGLLCLFILVLALTIVCICYSSWLAGKKDKKNTSSSRLSSSFSSSNDEGSSNGDRPKLTSTRTLSCSQYIHKRKGWLSRIFCCSCSDKVSSKRITPMRSLILQDDDNSSGGGSSSNDSNGLKATGKSMLLANNPNLTVHKPDLLDSIRSASMRATRTNQYGKQFNIGKYQINNNTITTTGRKSKQIKQARRQSYDDIDCVFTTSSSKPLDHEIGIQKHRQAHEYFVAVAHPLLSAGKSIGRRRSMLDACPTSSRGDLIGGNLSEREAEDGDDEAHRNDWIRDDTLSSCDSDKSCSPGANRNNRYNISEAHRAHLKSKNSGQIQARMFVTTSLGPQKSSSKNSGLLLRTIEQNNNHNSYHMQPDSSSNMPPPPVDYFDRISRMSSEKSTTDDSRAPLSDTTRNSRSTGGRNLHHPNHHQLASTRDGTTTRTFKATSSQSQVKRSKSTNNRILPTRLEHAPLTPIGGEISVDYINSDLVPMSAEEQWPEPYIDPADQEIPSQQQQPQIIQHHQQQQAGNAAFASFGCKSDGPQSQYVQFPTRHQQNNEQQYQQQCSARSQNVLTSASQRGKNRAGLPTHKRTGSGVTNQAFTYYDDAYLTNWHTMSRSRQQYGGYSTRDQENVMVANEVDLFHNHPDPLANSQSTLIRYRSIPSLNGFPQQENLHPQQHRSNNQLLSSQIGGATNWLRWTPTSLMNQRNLVDNNNNNDNGAGNSHKQFKNADDIGTPGSSDTNKSRLQNNIGQQPVMNGWHRDNYVEAVYVAANQQR